MIDANWVELVGGPLDGTVVEWRGKPGDMKGFRLTWDRIGDLGAKDAESLQGHLQDTPKGWATGWLDVCQTTQGRQPRGAATYTLVDDSKALYDPHASR